MRKLKDKFKRSTTRFSNVRVPAGDYTLRVELEIPEKELPVVNLDASLAPDEKRCLSVKCGRRKGNKITVDWQCKE